jgi:transcriptional regulator with XRE-family HTH domain
MQNDVRILFGKRLAEVRKQKGWSQEKLALESGIARSYLGGVERGKRNIALVNICKLADTLGVSPADLMLFNALQGLAAVT